MCARARLPTTRLGTPGAHGLGSWDSDTALQCGAGWLVDQRGERAHLQNLHLFFSFRDAERKQKVKQLFHSLATQEGEWKALKRKKFKK